MSMKTISEKRLFSRRKTYLAKSFSFYRLWQTSVNILLGCIRYYGNQCASYRIISVTPKRLLNTQIFEKEKTSFPPKKLFRPIFPRIVEYEEAQLTSYRDLQSIVTVIVQVIRSNF